MSTFFTALLLGYLLGSVPSAALVARLRGKSIFELGSGNMGAMNTARNLGMAWGVLVLLVDAGKGALAVGCAMWLANASGSFGAGAVLAPYAAGLGAVCGHAWSIYVGFRGGKALAVALGVSLVLFPLAGLAAMALLLGLLAVFRNAALASPLAAALLAPVLYLTGEAGAGLSRTAALWTAALMAVVIIVKHWPDVQETNRQEE
ncbi:MAG TPA: glycerol-3-phosphate acyltransferase [Trueperaceae bacterium]